MANYHSAGATIRALLARLEKAATPDDKARLMDALTHPARPIVVSFLNAHAVNLAVNDPTFAAALIGSDYLLRDGGGVKIGCKMFSIAPGINLNGTDLIPELFARFGGRRVALIGAEPEWLARTHALLKEANYGFSALDAVDGFRAESVYLDFVRTKAPELIVLGLGMPRQEQLAQKLRALMAESGTPATIVNGGAIIDFLAGKFPRAPLWMRKGGIEWLYRLSREPRRLAKRYVLGNPLFLARVLVARLVAPPQVTL